MQRAAVAALAKVASNLPLQRLLPGKYKQVFLDREASERARAAKAAADAEAREQRAKKPKERERQELHMSEEKRNLVEGLLRGALDEADAEAEADEDLRDEDPRTPDEAAVGVRGARRVGGAETSRLGVRRGGRRGGDGGDRVSTTRRLERRAGLAVPERPGGQAASSVRAQR